MEFNYQSLSDQTIFDDAVEEFKRAGYLLIKDSLTTEELGILMEASTRLKKYALENNEDDTVLRHYFREMSYPVLANSVYSEALHRGIDESYDQGMTDIFNPSFWFAKNAPDCLKFLQRFRSGPILELVKKINPAVYPKNNNLYIHQKVQTPRCAHIDSIRDYFKLFLALSDQTSASCGPFGVIPGTHSKKAKNYLMCQINDKIRGLKGGRSTDATFYRKKNLTPLLMDIGTLVISNQSIVHGAIPSSAEGSRLTFVQTFDR